MSQVMSCIMNRRSIRSFSSKKVSKEIVTQLVEAARWAPSGKNSQPWKFVIITEDEILKKKVASLSAYEKWLTSAPCLITVFLDEYVSYDTVKDVQAVGAAIQNMLLAGHDMGLGMCWVGEILKSEDEIKKLLDVPKNYRLMAVIAAGYADKPGGIGKRKEIKDIVFAWF